MATGSERSVLRVEGPDDLHVVRHVLVSHGLRHGESAWFPSFMIAGDGAGVPGDGRTALLRGVRTAVRLSEGKAVGFVLDADDSVENTWRAIADRLERAGVAPPPAMPPEGFVGESGEYRARVGVWLMPDNRQEGDRGEGTLEGFLETLVREADPLLPHAREATARAKTEHGARYSDRDARKAVLHAWLAWQKEPGLPYGTAIKARYFRHDSPAARSFVDWFRRVFEGD